MKHILLATAALLMAGCQSTLTELVVVVDAEPSIDAITIEVIDPGGHHETRTEPLSGAGAVTLPVTLGVVWRGGGLDPVTITARGLSAGSEVVSRYVVTGFVANETRLVRLDLLARCVAVTCGTDQSCGASGCAPAHVEAASLPRFDGTVARIADAGDVEDAGASIDASRTDDAGANIDASRTDAGVDASSPDIDANVTCTPACLLDHATATCTTAHTCAIASCESGFSNCDRMDATGCERSVRTNTDCNDCNLACVSTAGSTSCADGTCRITSCTLAMTADCNGQVSDGCEVNLRNDTQHCGTCTNACSAAQRCTMGACR